MMRKSEERRFSKIDITQSEKESRLFYLLAFYRKYIWCVVYRIIYFYVTFEDSYCILGDHEHLHGDYRSRHSIRSHPPLLPHDRCTSSYLCNPRRTHSRICLCSIQKMETLPICSISYTDRDHQPCDRHLLLICECQSRWHACKWIFLGLDIPLDWSYPALLEL